MQLWDGSVCSYLETYFKLKGISNCIHIEYSIFKTYIYQKININEARHKWKVSNNGAKVLFALGNTL